MLAAAALHALAVLGAVTLAGTATAGALAGTSTTGHDQGDDRNEKVYKLHRTLLLVIKWLDGLLRNGDASFSRPNQFARLLIKWQDAAR